MRLPQSQHRLAERRPSGASPPLPALLRRCSTLLSPTTRRTVVRVLLGVATAAAIIVPLLLWVPIHRGVSGAIVDAPKSTAIELATLATNATQYLVTLTTALCGLVGFMLTRKGSDLGDKLSSRWRITLALGAICLGVSLWTGFVVHQLVLQAAADAVVRDSLSRVTALHLLQLAELAAGVALMGAAVVFGAILK